MPPLSPEFKGGPNTRAHPGTPTVGPWNSHACGAGLPTPARESGAGGEGKTAHLNAMHARSAHAGDPPLRSPKKGANGFPAEDRTGRLLSPSTSCGVQFGHQDAIISWYRILPLDGFWSRLFLDRC
ncbi:MAG: hypothetical protein KatS3mg058_4038 [Roseiflexus sp.]|nr:MAG: hypothetical protein KatS3mg058_4038 [Roseiflexus sp.]